MLHLRVLKSRSEPLEVAAARVCREAGARVAENQLVRDLNADNVIDGRKIDSRKIEVIANGLPLWGGAQLAVDTALVSALTRDGQPRAKNAFTDTRDQKNKTYHELVNGKRCRLVVLTFEVGGRWSEEAFNFIRMLAKVKAESSPRLLRRSAELLWFRRWTGLLACAAQSVYATTLLELPLKARGACCINGFEPALADLDR